MAIASVQDRERLARWLRSPDADWFIDAAVLGELPAYEAGEILADYGLADVAENLRWLRHEIDAACREGAC